MSDKREKDMKTGTEADGGAAAEGQPEAQGKDAPCGEEAAEESMNERDALGGDTLQGEETSDAEEAPESQIKELERQRDEYKDLYLRKAADFDNYRKRMIREKQEAADFANTSLLVDLIQILDDFDRAISAAGTPEKGSSEAAFAEGILMIRRQMASMLENKYGLVYYPSPAGAPFDPNIHEAIASVPSGDVAEPAVQEECRKGYKLKDRVIRLAQVIVKMPAEG